MPLPNITSYILGTRQPMDYTSSALDAYLAVSRETRARQQQMMSDLAQSQDQMQSGQENVRRGQAHEQNMIDAQVNRAIRLEDQSFQREQMGWDREMHPLQMERAQLGLEAARFDLNVARPLGVEMDRLRLRTGQFELKAAAAQALAMDQKRSAFEGDLGTFQKILTGGVPSPDPSVVEGSFGMPGGAINGAPGMQVKGLKAGQMYWNHDMGVPFAVVDGDDGNPVAVAPMGNHSFQTDRAQRFTPIRPVSRNQIAAEKLPDIFAGVQNPGSPEMLAAQDRARDANAYLKYMEQGYADLSSGKGIIAGMRSLLERDPGYQLAQANGRLESPFEREQRMLRRDEQLRWAFPGDDDYQEWTSRNPSMLDSFRNLPDDQVESGLKRIEGHLKESRKAGPQISASMASELRKAEIAVIQARHQFEAAKGNAAKQYELPTIEANLRAAEEAVTYLRGQAGVSAPSSGATDAAKGYFVEPP